MVLVGGKKGCMNIESFMDQPERIKGLNIVFVWKEKKPMCHDEVLLR